MKTKIKYRISAAWLSIILYYSVIHIQKVIFQDLALRIFSLILGRGTKPVRRRMWAWLGIKTHAKQLACPSLTTFPNRSRKSFLSRSLSKIRLLSIPRTMIWCKVPGASSRGPLAMIYHYQNQKERSSYLNNLTTSPWPLTPIRSGLKIKKNL